MLLTSFRAKLAATVFLLAAGVTISALVLAERRFADSQQAFFEEQFEGQIELLISNRRQRSETLGRELAELAKNPRLADAMKSKNQGGIWGFLLPELEKMAQDAMAAMRPLGGAMPQASGGVFGGGKALMLQRLGERAKFGEERQDNGEKKPGRLPIGLLPFYGLVDAGGKFVLSQRGKAAAELATDSDLRRKSGKLGWLGGRELSEVLADQEVGYLLVEGPDGRAAQVREVFITPVRSEDGKEFFGAFVFGLPLPSGDERMLYEQSKRADLGKIMSGVWVEDMLVSTTVPDEQRAELAAIVGRELEKSQKPGRELTAVINGQRHRIIYRVLNEGSPFPVAAQVSFYSLAALDREVAGLRKSVGGLGIAALAVAFGLVFIMSRSFSRPIQQLAAGTREIERGNFAVRVPVRSRDEIGQLAQGFNQMAAGLALQEKYRSVLNAVADRTVAQELIENRTALGGEIREAAVLFCDIRGFTALTEKMPPHEVIELLNEHMTALTDAAYRHGGIVDKFVGDLIMVLFGAPRSTGQDSLCAVRCAWEMLALRRRLNESSAQPLEIGIGIATGSMVAGCMGSEQRLSYTVLGERVNLASRLCGIAQAGEIIIDEATRERCGEAVQAAARPAASLKGFSGTVPCYRVTAVSEPAA